MKMKNLVPLLCSAVILGAPIQSFADETFKHVQGAGAVKGHGAIKGNGVVRGEGTASGTGVVLYHDANGNVRYKKGTGTVSGKGIAIGHGTAAGKGRAAGRGHAIGKGQARRFR